LQELARPYGVQSFWLASADHRPATAGHASPSRASTPAAYDAADVGFLRLVANQVAVAVENALAFQEIEAAFRESPGAQDQLAKEKAYLEEEVRTEHNFGDIVGTAPPCAGFSRRSRPSPPPIPPSSSTGKPARGRN